MAQRPLTQKQSLILAFIHTESAAKGRPPTLREIGAHFSMAAPSVADHLDAIEAKGHIARVAGERRNIRLPRRTHDDVESALPIVGRIAAGVPLLSPGQVEGWISVSPALFRPRATFLLRVRGDSMIDLGIRNGDMVAIHAQPDASDGQVVAAVVVNDVTGDHEMTLKRLRVSRKNFLLLSENHTAAHPAIEFEKEPAAAEEPRLLIAGVYVGHLHIGPAGRP